MYSLSGRAFDSAFSHIEFPRRTLSSSCPGTRSAYFQFKCRVSATAVCLYFLLVLLSVAAAVQEQNLEDVASGFEGWRAFGSLASSVRSRNVFAIFARYGAASPGTLLHQKGSVSSKPRGSAEKNRTIGFRENFLSSQRLNKSWNLYSQEKSLDTDKWEYRKILASARTGLRLLCRNLWTISKSRLITRVSMMNQRE